MLVKYICLYILKGKWNAGKYIYVYIYIKWERNAGKIYMFFYAGKYIYVCIC